MRKFFLILTVIVAVPAFLTAINNDAGAYLCAYVSTALLMFSILDFLRRSRRGLPYGMTGIVAGFGIVSALFMSMSQIVGPSLYVAFMVGQAITVGVVLWLYRSLSELSPAKAESGS